MLTTTKLFALGALAALVCTTACGGDAGGIDDDETLQSEEELSGGDALVGLADEDPNAVSPATNPVLVKLHDDGHVRSERKIIPWDVMDQPSRADVQDLCARWMGCAPRAFADWLANASAWQATHPRTDVYLTVSFWNGTTVKEPVPMSVFKSRVRRLFETYGGEGTGTANVLGKTYRFHRVKYWGFLNESDLAPAVTRDDPRLAARYFLAAHEVARTSCKGCVLVAGEFGRPGRSAFDAHGYITEYFDEIRAAHVEPQVVSMHAYGDVNGLRTTDARRFLKHAKETFPSAQVWLSEEGVMLHDAALHNAGDRGRQEKAARTFERLTRLRGVDRAYFYNTFATKPSYGDPYQGPGNWDSGLLDWNDAPRPALCVLTGQQVSACDGSLEPSPYGH